MRTNQKKNKSERKNRGEKAQKQKKKKGGVVRDKRQDGEKRK